MDTDDLDLREHLARSFGDGPEHRSLDDRLAAGRRALRRRRIGTGLVAATVVAALGTTWAVASGSSDRAVRDPGYVTSEARVPGDVRVATEEEATRLLGGPPADYTPEGELVVHPRWSVDELVANPLALVPPERSTALAVTDQATGERQYVLVYWRPSGAGWTTSDPREEVSGSFRKWVRGSHPTGTAPEPRGPERSAGPSVDLIDGEVVLGDGVQVLRRTENPLGYAPPGVSVGLAVVEDGHETWVLMASPGGASQWTTYDPARKRVTFDEWLADVAGSHLDETEKAPVVIDQGTLSVTSGVTLLEEVWAPAEAAAYGLVEETAAAKVTMPDGRVRFVLAIARRHEDTVVLDPAVLPAPTMDAFLAHLARQGESGEGLR